MISYEVFGYILISLCVLFLIIDFFLQKQKIYQFLKNKLHARYALQSNLYNLQYQLPNQTLYNVFNFLILNSYKLFKISLIFSIFISLLFKNIIIFLLPILILLLTIVTIIISKKLHLKKSAKLASMEALEEYKPTFVFYFSAPSNSHLFHIHMWLSYLKQTNLKFYIMVREPIHHEILLKTIKDVPIVIALTMSDIEFYLPSTIKLAFYANNGTKNTHLVRFNNITHIQLLHGDSEKPPSYNPISKMYDKLFVSGQRAIDRYCEKHVIISNNVFEIVGRPQLSCIDVGTRDVQKEKLSVLFAPTWVGLHKDSMFSSLFEIYDVIKYLVDAPFQVKIILRLHPLTNKNNPKTKAYLSKIEKILQDSNTEHLLFSTRDIIDDFNDADCIVTDISSVPIDFLYSEKPIIHIDVNQLSIHFETDIKYSKYKQGVYIIQNDMSNIENIFSDVKKNDILKEARQKVKAYYHGSFTESLDSVFVSKIHHLLEHKI